MANSYQNLLYKLKWIDNSALTFSIDRDGFESRLQSHLDPYRPQGMFEVFSSSPNDYVGKIKGDELLMRRKRKMFDWTMGSVTVNGQIKESGGQVHVSSKIEYPSWVPALTLSLFSLIYGLAFILVFTGVFSEEVPMMWLYLILHFIILFSIFYFILRKGISSAKHHFERDMKRFVGA